MPASAAGGVHSTGASPKCCSNLPDHTNGSHWAGLSRKNKGSDEMESVGSNGGQMLSGKRPQHAQWNARSDKLNCYDTLTERIPETSKCHVSETAKSECFRMSRSSAKGRARRESYRVRSGRARHPTPTSCGTGTRHRITIASKIIKQDEPITHAPQVHCDATHVCSQGYCSDDDPSHNTVDSTILSWVPGGWC